MMKLRLLLLVFLALFIAILSKLFYVQFIKPVNPGAGAYLHTGKINAERGKIFDRNMNPLVLNQNSYLLFAEPKIIQDKDYLIRQLSSVLQIPEASLSAKYDETKVWLALHSGIDEDMKKKIDSLHLKGIGLDYSMSRYYPEASLAAHLVGFVGKNNINEDTGYFGLEGFYDKDLIGLPGFLESERDLLGMPIFIGTQERTNSENGRDLVLTIDKTVQEISKRKLLEGMESYKAKSGCVITADPFTMQIFSLVCLPDYSIEKYYKFSEEYFKDSAISDLYEPGSTFKPLIVAAALQEKKIKPDSIFNETGPVTIGEYRIQTWDNKYEGEISITRILEKSSNVGMIYIGSKLGDENVFNYLKKYGFGELTGIDLQGEDSSYLKQKKDWYPIDYATATFGQGIVTTPIQMIRAFASVINGGKLMRPYVVEKMIGSNGKETVIQPKMERQTISKSISDIIKKMLVDTVEHGEVKWAKPKGYVVGGKTGTAQIALQGHYDASKTIASFIGFAPADNPKFITLVILKEPQSSIWGSETAAPIFFEIAKELLVYYNIAPQQ
ncbi:MAG: penicillin-binding protein 2 [bacterium]|nr:penicillin-binding protein 2 [bacterium]